MSKRIGSRRQSGYTMIEVLMALAVMTSGAMGIFALQKASMRGNFEARQMTMATNIARTWLERMRRDALLWTVGGQGAAAANLTTTRYLSSTPATGGLGAWFTPIPPIGSLESYAFDHFGNDTLNGLVNTTSPEYCVNTRSQWVFPGQVLRVDVRVWWNRLADTDVNITDRRAHLNCDVGNEANITGDNRLRFVNASTLLRWNEMPQ